MKPILFNTDMVRAILEGRKTVTRRVVEFKHGQNPKWTGYIPDGPVLYGSNNIPAAKAPYRIGDILYVRETWRIQAAHRFEADARIEFKAGGPMATIQFPGCRSQGTERREYDAFLDKWLRSGWCPSIHMPKETARLFLRVTDVRVERLFDSFVEQGSTIFCLQDEGVDIGDHCRQCIENHGNPCCNDFDPELEVDEDTGEDANGGSECGVLDEIRTEFSHLWDSTIKPTDRDQYGWSNNPWVWVISFERISREAANG